MGLRKHVVSDLIKRLSTFVILALSTSAPMFLFVAQTAVDNIHLALICLSVSWKVSQVGVELSL